MDYSRDEDTDDKIEIELAGGWERIGAVLLNYIFSTLTMLPFMIHFFISLASVMAEDGNSIEKPPSFMAFWWLLIPIGFQIYQLVLLSQHGHTLGKKLLNLKIIRQNGEVAGFVHGFLLREAVYQFAISTVLGILSALLTPFLLPDFTQDAVKPEDIMNLYGTMMLINFLGILSPVICFIMLFAQREKRTLQDFIADTVVIKIPRESYFSIQAT